MEASSSTTAPNELNYDKLIGLFNGEYSNTLQERHVGVVDRVCRVNSDGFAIRDLPYIEIILNFILEKVVEGKGDVFSDSLCKLLRTLAKPFVRRTATDEFKMFNNISRIIETISRVFCPNVPHDAQICAAEVLAEFASAYGSRPSVVDANEDVLSSQGVSPRQFHTNQRLLERSGAIPSCVRHGFTKAMKTTDSELQLALMKTLLQCSYSPENATQICETGALLPLMMALDRDFADPLVFTGIELLWNLLENGKAAKMIATNEVVCQAFAKAVTNLFQVLVSKGYKLADKELRNEVLLVSSMAAKEDVTRTALQESGFLSLILTVSTTPEIPDQPLVLKPFCQTKEIEDFEMRELAWMMVGEMCQNEICLGEAVRRKFVKTLLIYLDREQSANSGVTKWSRGQVHDLQVQALSTLHRITPLMPESFSDLQGNELLLRFITEGPVPDLLQGALRLLRLNASLSEYKEILGHAGTISLALQMFLDTESMQSVKEHAVAVLSLLCLNKETNQTRFRKQGGIVAIKNAIVGLKAVDHTLPTAFATQLIDCLWNAIVGNRKNLARFLAEDGMEAIMDLLEVCNAYLYPVILSCLADLLENKKSHPFFHEWKSSVSHGKTAAQLLLDIWRNEENARHMSSEVGIIQNTSRPMSGDGTRTEWIPSLDTSYSFQSESKKSLMKSLTEVVTGEKIFEKIYSVLKNLGFDTLDYMAAKDKMTLETVIQYVKFKQGEVWQDIQVDFDLTNMKPTAPDMHRIHSGIDKSENLAKHLTVKQAELLAESNETQEADNKTFYQQREEMHIQEADAKVYKRNLSTLTMKERLEAKLKKEQMLKNSFKPALTVGLGAPEPELQAS